MNKIRNFPEGHSTVGEWQGSGRAVAGERHGNGMVFVNRPLASPCRVSRRRESLGQIFMPIRLLSRAGIAQSV
jgi:hypothetical protein